MKMQAEVKNYIFVFIGRTDHVPAYDDILYALLCPNHG